jgi:hypothetical protein
VLTVFLVLWWSQVLAVLTGLKGAPGDAANLEGFSQSLTSFWRKTS